MQRPLTTLRHQTARLSTLIDNLLDLSLLRTGQFELQRQRLDLAALTQRVVEDIQPTLEQHTIDLQLSTEPVLIAGDALRLEQVLHNLLGNAIKYSPDGGLIAVSVALQNEQATLAVTDEGIGIPAAALPDLFQPFYRADNQETLSRNGLGIGLYIAHEILERHGGTIEVTSREGYGSTFTIRLPRLSDDTTDIDQGEGSPV